MLNLFVNYYLCGNDERQKEIDTCLQKNIDNKFIDYIFVFLDQNINFKFKSEKIVTINLARPKYSDFIFFINEFDFFENSYNMIANTDIYFDESLELLEKINMKNTCVALNRWDILPNDELRFLCTKGSQDVWIFYGKIKESLIPISNFYLGKKCCDNVFAGNLYKTNYRAISPSYSIKAYHLHKIEYRTWNEGDKIIGHHMYIIPCDIDQASKEEDGYYDIFKEGNVHLIMPFYIPKEEERYNEICYCLKKNIENKCIHKIFLLSETSEFPDFIVNHDIDFFNIKKRCSYKDMIQFVNSNNVFFRSYNILSNNDIYFDDSLKKLQFIDFHSKCLALSRHDVKENDIIEPPTDRWANISQDSWIFKGVISNLLMNRTDFYLGLPGCDNKFAYEATCVGYRVINPCHDIKIYHYHKSGLRSYTKAERLNGPYQYVPAIKI